MVVRDWIFHNNHRKKLFYPDLIFGNNIKFFADGGKTHGYLYNLLVGGIVQIWLYLLNCGPI